MNHCIYCWRKTCQSVTRGFVVLLKFSIKLHFQNLKLEAGMKVILHRLPGMKLLTFLLVVLSFCCFSLGLEGIFSL